MKTNSSLLCLAAFSVVLSGCQPKQGGKKEEIPQEHQKKALGEVQITEMQPDEQLNRAIDAFARGEQSQCANDLKEAIATMHTLASSVTGKQKEKMENAAASLEDLAGQIASGKVNDLSTINHALGKVGRALANYRLSVTETEFFAKTPEESGKNLELTIKNLENVIVKNHRVLTPAEKQVLDDASSVAIKLKYGTKVDEDDLKDALNNVDMEIEKWNKEFETR
jgi:hypothetical protein